MKHLLIILSILLLSSPVIGDNHKGETLYLWKTNSGEVWKEFGDKDIHAKYKGDVENGKPSGLGLVRLTDGAKYVGVWKDGKRHGQGTIIRPNGEETSGEWYYGLPWNVTYYDKYGIIFIKYVNGKIKWDQKKGDFHQSGIFYHGFRNGVYGYFKEKWHGVENTKNKDYGTYEGEMINGKPHGQATQTFYNGEKYEGEWSKGIPNGQGTYTYPDGEKFVGELRFAVHWNGTYYDKDGNIVSKFVNGKIELDQKKSAFLQSGVFYLGLRNGVYGLYIEKWDGVENTKNEDYGKYVGGIKDGKRDGIGTYTWSDGSKYAGSWLEGKMWNGTEYDRDGNITGKVVNNQFIKQ